MKHKRIYILYFMILLSAVSWRVTRAYPSLSEIKKISISETQDATLVSIDLTKPAKTVPFLKSLENCIVLDFDKTIISKDLGKKAFASRDIKLAYLSALDTSKTANKEKPKNNKKIRAKFFMKPDCLPSVKYVDNKVILKLAVKDKVGKNLEESKVSLMHPREEKCAPVVISLENAPFKPVVSEIATQAGMDIQFAGKLPESLSIELQSEDPFEALCSIAVKTDMKFYRDGKTWFMEGEK